MRIESSGPSPYYPHDTSTHDPTSVRPPGAGRPNSQGGVRSLGRLEPQGPGGQPLALPASAGHRPGPGLAGLVDSLRDRVSDAIGSLVTGIIDGLRGLFAGLGNAATRPGSSCAAAAETAAGTAVLVGLRTVSAAQSLLGCEPAGRPLSEDEACAMRRVFGDALDLGSVEIKEGNAGAFGIEPRPFTVGNVIYTKDRSCPPELLAHELVHVWQNQHAGAGYMIGSVTSQYFGDGYDWRQGVAEGKAWNELNTEQQAQLIEDAFASGHFKTGKDEGNRRFVVDGVDYTDYLRAALIELRAGRGA